MSGREQATAVALLMAACEVLRDPNARPIEKKHVVDQIDAFLRLDGPPGVAPPPMPARVVHRFKPGVLPEGDGFPDSLEADSVVCEALDLASGIALDELPPADVRATMPPHTICPVCFPDAPKLD